MLSVPNAQDEVGDEDVQDENDGSQYGEDGSQDEDDGSENRQAALREYIMQYRAAVPLVETPPVETPTAAVTL